MTWEWGERALLCGVRNDFVVARPICGGKVTYFLRGQQDTLLHPADRTVKLRLANLTARMHDMKGAARWRG